MGTVRLKGWKDLGRWVRKLSARTQGGMYDVVEENMTWAAQKWEDRMRERVSSPGGKHTGKALARGKPPGVRSGALRRSFRSKVIGRRPDLRSLKAGLWSTRGKIAYTQEYGTKGYPGNASSPIPTIRPKRSKFLTIPMPGALTASGRPKGGRRFARQWPDLFFYVAQSGQPFLAQAESGPGDGKLTMIYMLKRSVDLGPRLGMRKVFGEVSNQFLRRIDADVPGALSKALARR